MKLVLALYGHPYADVPLDFTGKITVEDRQRHIDELGKVLKEEFAPEIERSADYWEIYYDVIGRACGEEFTSFEERQVLARIRARHL